VSSIDWREIDRILATVIELPENDRAARIQELCSDCAELRAEVESLLAAHKNAGSFLAVETKISSEASGRASLSGRQLGSYRLLDIIGAGGMGTVYRAERIDGQFQKRVAIKVVPAAIHSPELQRRFNSEQQILASLEHPNIARLLDAGISSDGIPYFVMEYVDGAPINQYSDSRALGAKERLRIFQTVCESVQYAHQHLVVHRDIKPANILISADGVPKLLDFGVAKILDPWRAGLAEATHSLLNPMTPAYASPEQARGEKLTTASDIYSLGVVLYELLTGLAAQPVAGKSLEEAIRIITETEPPKPTTAIRNKTGADNLARTLELSADVDAIVAKAMRKDPQHRYSSARELSSDISRHLEGMPVLAHRGSLRYVAGKFAARHTAGVLAAIVGLILAISGFGLVVRQNHIAERERALAQRRFDDVRSLAKSLMFEVHDSIKDLPGATPARKLLVTRASQYLDSLSREAGNDVGLQRELAAAYERLGDVQGNPELSNLGDPVAALTSYGKAARLRETVLMLQPRDSALKLDLSGTYLKIGICKDTSSDLSGALISLQRARIMAEESGVDRQDPSFVDALAAAHWAIARVTREQGDLPAALEGYRTAVALRESARVTDPAKQTEFRIRIAASEREIAEVLRQQKLYAAAVETAARSLASLESASEKDPDNSTLRRWVGAGYDQLGTCLEDAGKLDEALDNFRRGREIFYKTMVKDPTDTDASRVTGFMDLEVGRVLVKKGDPRGALPLLHEALKTFQNLAKSSPEISYLSDDFANVYSELGMAYASLGSDLRLSHGARREQWLQAQTCYGKSRDIWQEQRRQGKLLTENSEEPNRLSKEIEKCVQALAKL
jgi:tetratricopeptide (TPR) repeat protein